jgi:hypothetical protein
MGTTTVIAITVDLLKNRDPYIKEDPVVRILVLLTPFNLVKSQCSDQVFFFLMNRQDFYFLHCIAAHPMSLKTNIIAITIPTDLPTPLVLNP